MRGWLTMALVVLAATAAAQTTMGNRDTGNRDTSNRDASNRPPAKAVANITPNVPSPTRQAGDTVETATVIASLPFADTGTTTGFHDDYAATCFYENGAPDVVYRFEVPAGVEAIEISLCGSAYDTGMYVLDADLIEVACNDDDCGLQSRLTWAPVAAGEVYYIVVDGYGTAHGDYTLRVEEFVPCVLPCPPDAFPEGEPPLVDDYVDTYNGGCNTPGYPFQTLMGDANGELVFWGVSGWYHVGGSNHRDTDWFYVYMGSGDLVEIRGDAEQPTDIMAIPNDCNLPAVNWMITVGDCRTEIITFDDHLPRVDWVVIIPPTFAAPPGAPNEYDYVVWFSGLEPGGVSTESATWGTVKALYQ